MTLQQMKYLLEVVRCGSISEAAKELFISQPSLSAAVREVEKEMNIEIFHRTPKGMQLTTDDIFAMIVHYILGYRRDDAKYQSKEEHYY